MEKIKQFLESDNGKDILTVIIVILVGLGSFELGRLSKEDDNSGIKILSAQAREYSDQDASMTSTAAETTKISQISTSKTLISSDKNFFASSRGTKYYSIECSAGKNVKEENRIYFKTRENAEQAGYTLSSSCR